MPSKLSLTTKRIALSGPERPTLPEGESSLRMRCKIKRNPCGGGGGRANAKPQHARALVDLANLFATKVIPK